MRVGVVGATGLVGAEMMRVLEERLAGRITAFSAFASDGSAGRTVSFLGRSCNVLPASSASVEQDSFILGATSAEAAAEWVPAFVSQGAIVIDNSSRYRMDPDVPLVVPEVNISSVMPGCRLIANPNCCAIQLVMVLRPLMDLGEILWASVSTYQSVSGAGSPALEKLDREESGASPLEHREQFHGNVLPGIGQVRIDGYCEEEEKLIRETGRILDASFPVYAACARVPVRVGHLESVVIGFAGAVDAEAAAKALAGSRGIEVAAEGAPPVDVAGTDKVVAGRIRNFPGDPRILQLWITADNVRKGAALNAVQILEALAQRPVQESHCSPPMKSPV